MGFFFLTHIVCPYQFFPCEKSYYDDHQEEIDELCNDQVELTPFVLQPEGESGPQLDAITIIPNHQKREAPENQKWIVFALPNIINHQNPIIHTFLINLARHTGLCIATTNYRGARKEPRHRPQNMENLANDFDYLVKTRLATYSPSRVD